MMPGRGLGEERFLPAWQQGRGLTGSEYLAPEDDKVLGPPARRRCFPHTSGSHVGSGQRRLLSAEFGSGQAASTSVPRVPRPRQPSSLTGEARSSHATGGSPIRQTARARFKSAYVTSSNVLLATVNHVAGPEARGGTHAAPCRWARQRVC